MPLFTQPQAAPIGERFIQSLIAKQELEQRKEALKIQQGEFKLKQEVFAAEQQQAQDAAADAEAQRAAAALILPLLMGGLTDVEVSGAFAGADPRVAAAGLAIAPGLQQLQAETGLTLEQTRGVKGAADLGEATFDSNVALKRQEVIRSFKETQGISLQNALLKARVAQDPQRVDTAWDLMQTGELTAGQAFAASGAVLPASIPRDFKLNPIAAGAGAGGESAAKAASLHALMTASNATINQLTSEGVRLGLFESWNRSSTNWLSAWTSGIFVDEKQRNLIQAQKQFADAYRFFISGQQSSDREAERLLFTVLENPGDAQEVMNQKRFMRGLVINMAADVAGGRLDPAQAAQRILDTAIRNQMPEAQIEVFRQQLADAQMYTATGGPEAAMQRAREGGRSESLLSGVLGGR